MPEDDPVPDLNFIPAEIQAPQPDDLAREEESNQINLPAVKYGKYLAKKQIADLRRQVDRLEKREATLEADNRVLQDCRVENAAFKTSNGYSRLLHIVCSCFIIVGGLLVDSNDRGDPIHGIGWGLVIVCVAMSLLVGLFDPQKHD